MSVNHFIKWLERTDLKIPVPGQEHSNKIVLSEQELNQYIEVSKEKPIWHMIALFQIDGLLRPSEFSILKISNMDLAKRFISMISRQETTISYSVHDLLNQSRIIYHAENHYQNMKTIL